MSSGSPSIAEEQRRIHELESQREREREQTPEHESRPHAEVPAFLARPEPVPAAPAELAPPPPPPAPEPKIDSKELLESSGLVMIETDRSKEPAAPQAEAPAQLGRPRRERPKSSPQDETLEQVETRK